MISCNNTVSIPYMHYKNVNSLINAGCRPVVNRYLHSPAIGDPEPISPSGREKVGSQAPSVCAWHTSRGVLMRDYSVRSNPCDVREDINKLDLPAEGEGEELIPPALAS